MNSNRNVKRHLPEVPLEVAALAEIFGSAFPVAFILAFFVFASGRGDCLLAETRPNIMIVLVDDLGYSDLGCYGGEIETPNIDQLAADGLRFNSFYNTGRCWPTRAAILTGYYAQQVRRDKLPGIKSGGGGNRPAWARLLPAMLKPAGYRSYHSGKWHVDSMPIATGFDRSYYLGDQARFFSPKRIWIDDQKQPAVERGSGFYGTTAIADHAIRHLKEHQTEYGDQPFFYYLAFTAPHFPLHALEVDYQKYRNRYDRGWDVIRRARVKKIRESGLVNSNVSEVDFDQGPPYEFPEQIAKFGPGEMARPAKWDALNEVQQEYQSMKMGLHAAMIDRIDQEFGRVLNQLRQMQALDNTLIMFLSDNGASAEIMIRDDGHDPTAAPGSAATHFCLGPGWSTVCNTPFRKHKTWVHEGGIGTPMVMHWPAGIQRPGQIDRTPAHVIDLVPTILELAEQRWQATESRQPNLPGKSLVSAIRDGRPPERDYLWWSHENNRAIRVDQWKLVKARDADWELFDLAVDRNETTNLASRLPDRVEQMKKRWQQVEQEFIEIAKPKQSQR